MKSIKYAAVYFAVLALMIVNAILAPLKWLTREAQKEVALFCYWIGIRLGWVAMLDQTYPTLDDFRKYMVTQLDQVEVIRQSLYDTVLYPTAGMVQLLFFQVPQGQGISVSPGNAAGAKALSDTNMQLAGQLPAPQGFFIQSVELDFQPGSVNTANTFTLQTAGSSAAAPAAATGLVQLGAINDVNAFYSTGALSLNIGNKWYLQEGALMRFPPKGRFELDAAVGGNSATTANFGAAKLKAGGRPYQLQPGLAIMTSQAFNVALSWPVVVATPSGFNGAVRTILDGWLFRGVQ